MKPFRLLFALALSLLFLPVCPGQTKDAKGCSDSVFLSRFPGSIITDCTSLDDNSYKFNMGAGKPAKAIEGKYELIHYRYPSTASKAESRTSAPLSPPSAFASASSMDFPFPASLGTKAARHSTAFFGRAARLPSREHHLVAGPA